MSRRPSIWSSSLVRFSGATLLLALLVSVVWLLPIVQVSSLPSPTSRIQAEIAARDVLVKAIGGLLVFITAFVSVRNLRVSEDKQIAERFSKAVEMLSHEESVHIRLGGIYALERIARDSKKDRNPVMQVLAAFVRTKALAASGQKSDVRQLRLHLSEEFSDAREHHEDEKEERDERERENWRNYSPEGTYEYFIGTLNKDYVPKYLIEVQAALSAIGKQNSGTYPLDLSKTVLEGITLEGNYENVSFYETHFKDCVFGNQSGEKTTSFRGDSFVRATFEKVEFIDSDIRKAHLDNSVLISATFNDSDFREATLTKARFSGGTKICKCKFNGTTWNESRIGDLIVWTERSTNSQITALKALRSAYFTDQSEVSDTDMTGAKFEGVKLVNTLFKRTLFKKGRYKGMSFERAILSGVIFENVDLSDSDFTEAQIGYEATFYNSSEHCKRREDYQENYSDEVVFAKAGIKRADLEKGKAIIIKATFS